MRAFILVLALFVAVPAASAQSADDLFRQALVKERTEGDLAGAIALYERVVLASSDRTLTADALVRIGQNYERLGLDGALDAYQRVVAEFEDQTEPVEVARKRLAALIERPDSRPRSSTVYTLPFRTHGNSDENGMYGAHISSSRRLLARESDSNGITVDDLETGTTLDYSNAQLGCPRTDDREGVIATIKFSPDERLVAFQCWDYRGQIGILDLSAGSVAYFDPTVVFEADEGYSYNANVIAWANNGKELLTSVRRWKRPTYTYPVQDFLAFFSLDGELLRMVDDSPTESSYFEQEKACLTHDDSIMVGEYVTGDGTTSLMSVKLRSGKHTRLLPADPRYRDETLFGCLGNDVVFGRKQGDRQWLYRASVGGNGNLAAELFPVREIPAEAISVMSEGESVFYTLNLGATCHELEGRIDREGRFVSSPTLSDCELGPERVRATRYLPDGALLFSPEFGDTAYRFQRPDGSVIEAQLPIADRGDTQPVFSIGGSPGPVAGNYVLFRFFEDRHGFNSTWILDSRTGMVVDSLSGVYARGITPDLSAYYIRDPNRKVGESCLQRVHRDSGITETVGCIPYEVGFNEDIDPETGHIALITRLEDDTFPIYYVDEASDEVREIFRSEHGNTNILWSGGSLYISQGRWGEDGAYGFYRFDPDTGEVVPLALIDELQKLGAVAWRPRIPVSTEGMIRTILIAPRMEVEFEMWEVVVGK